jgi:hypothetical protein
MRSPLKLTQSGLIQTKRVTTHLGMRVLAVAVIALLGAYSSTDAVLPGGGSELVTEVHSTPHTVPGAIIGEQPTWFDGHAAWADGHAAWAG